MTKSDIDHLLRCIETKTVQFEYAEYISKDKVWGDSWTFEIGMNNKLDLPNSAGMHSLIKYESAIQGYQTLESSREAFVLNFLGSYLKQFIK